MMVSLPFAYQITGRLPKSRRMDREIAVEVLAFPLREVSGADAPVAVEWTRTAEYNHFGKHAVGPEGRVEVRVFEDKFYRPVVRDGRKVGAPDVETLVLVDYAALSSDPMKLIDAQRAAIRVPGTYPVPAFEGETFSNRQEVLEALEVSAASVLIVDGSVWQECREPVLVLEEGFLSPGFEGDYSFRRIEEYFTFAMDETERAVSFGREFFGGEDVVTCGDVTVWMPEAISRSGVVEDVLRLSGKTLRKAGRVTLNDTDLRFVTGWAALAGAYEAARLTPEDSEVEALLDAWASFCAITQRPEGCHLDDRDVALSVAMQDRYGDREMSPDALFTEYPRPR